MNEYTSNGIMYTWELASSEGASFILFPSSDNTKSQISAAKTEIRRSRDVVSLKLANEEDLDYHFKSAIFREPETRKLKWYQIEQDEKVIRKARLEGINPNQFVQQYVLPNVAQTEQKMLEKFGNKIYGI